MNEKIYKTPADGEDPFLPHKHVAGRHVPIGGIPLPEVHPSIGIEHDVSHRVTHEAVATASLRGHETMIKPSFIPKLEPDDHSTPDPAIAEAATRIVTMPPDARQLPTR